MGKQNHITETEYEIMKYLWSLDHDATAGEIRQHFADRNWSKQAVSTFLKRLVNSGYLKMIMVSPTKYCYNVLISENEHNLLPVHEIIENIFSNSFKDFICAFVNSDKKLSEEEVDQLNKIFSDLKYKYKH